MTWLTLSMSYIDLMRRNDCGRDQAREEILHDLISGEREAAGHSRDGLPEIIPRHVWAVAAIKDDNFFDASGKQSPVLVDFRENKVATWSSNPYKRGYETAYSDVHVSPLSANATVQAPILADAPGPTQERRPRANELRIDEWVRKWIAELQSNGEQGSEERVWSAAQEHFKGAERRNIVLASYHKRAPAEWRKQGRRRQKPAE